jgi:hypothetical protein
MYRRLLYMSGDVHGGCSGVGMPGRETTMPRFHIDDYSNESHLLQPIGLCQNENNPGGSSCSLSR